MDHDFLRTLKTLSEISGRAFCIFVGVFVASLVAIFALIASLYKLKYLLEELLLKGIIENSQVVGEVFNKILSDASLCVFGFMILLLTSFTFAFCFLLGKIAVSLPKGFKIKDL